ncbi:hypothetical protein BT63DRAFT_414112 [Microthyrium microscopicum]|uniref:Transcription factor domain-containing protein n=1 Tax=Microthyrium microscopicum TaxID=703497 RepID=A0A6A6UDS5_9PEZI|nr:hypothetical protein BT63DRAFT_414112 [Microthyrium microscopicum]
MQTLPKKTKRMRTGTNNFIHTKTPPSALLSDVRCLINMLGSEEALDHASQLNTIPPGYMQLLHHTLINIISAIPTLHDHASLLPFTQSLILVQILTLFILPPGFIPPWIQQTSQARRKLLNRAMRKLWQAAPASISSTLSKHEAYALAESIRRTVIMALELEAQCSVYETGVYSISLFGITFPFDRRFRLWGIESVAFEKAIEKSGDGYGIQHMQRDWIR